MKFTQATAAAVLAYASGVSAHMRMAWPVPFNFPTMSQDPLSPEEYPCKQSNGFAITKMNDWNAGETKQVSFLGSAVHGGGSCQFSITTDKKPSKDTQWKVIHSVIGGCPSTAEGNLSPADADGTGADKFDVMMPKDVPSGEYTFAWTWFNKIGNREMYMNCAPITVGGGASGDGKQFFSGLPDMFVANLPNTTCGTTEGQNFKFPEPGKSVETKQEANIGDTLTGSDCAGLTKWGAGNGAMGSPSGGSDTPTSEEPSKPSEAAPSNTGGVFAPSAAPQSTEAPQPTEAPTTQPQTPTTGSGCQSCSSEGAIVCIGSSQFGICANGCAIPQALAAGTSCSNGQIMRRQIRAPRAHLARRHGINLV